MVFIWFGMISIVFQWFSLSFNWFSMIIIDFQWFPLILNWFWLILNWFLINFRSVFNWLMKIKINAGKSTDAWRKKSRKKTLVARIVPMGKVIVNATNESPYRKCTGNRSFLPRFLPPCIRWCASMDFEFESVSLALQ